MVNEPNNGGSIDDRPEPVCDGVCDGVHPEAAPGTIGAETVRCSKCGREVDDEARRAGRCPPPCGCFVKFNRAAVTHGGRSLQLRGPVDALARLRYDDVRAGLRADFGDVPATTRTLLHDRLAEAALLAEVTWLDMTERGVLTKSGRRRAVVDLYLAASERVTRLSLALGLERRSRDVGTLSPAEWVASQDTPPASQDDAGAATVHKRGPRDGGTR